MTTTHLTTWPTVTGTINQLRAKVERDFSCLRTTQPHVLQLALNEAEALAWETGFPELVFPTLAQEKARSVATWHERQKALRQATETQSLAA